MAFISKTEQIYMIRAITTIIWKKTKLKSISWMKLFPSLTVHTTTKKMTCLLYGRSDSFARKLLVTWALVWDLRRADALGTLSAIFAKGDNLWPLWKRRNSEKKEFALLTELLPLHVYPFPIINVATSWHMSSPSYCQKVALSQI